MARKYPQPSPAGAVPVMDPRSRRMALANADLLHPEARMPAPSPPWNFAGAGPRLARIMNGSPPGATPVLSRPSPLRQQGAGALRAGHGGRLLPVRRRAGCPSGEERAPCFCVGAGIARCLEFFQSAQGPLLLIFIRTAAFAMGTAAIQPAMGLLLACLAQRPFIRVGSAGHRSCPPAPSPRSSPHSCSRACSTSASARPTSS